jgi:Uma2 family endonuclease
MKDMETLVLDLKKRYTYADYLAWIDDVRRELIDGFIKLFPAPVDIHAKVSYRLTRQLGNFIESTGCGCEIRYAPYDVRLPENGEIANDKIYTVVQPDISIICDLSKLDINGCIGAPDMIVEILSPSNRKRDLLEKFYLYQKFGVREYWIADPKVKTVTVYIMQQDGEYNDGEVYQTGEKVPVHIFNGHMIDMNAIFDF